MPGIPLGRALTGLALLASAALTASAEPLFLERRDWWPFEQPRPEGAGDPEALPPELRFSTAEAARDGQPWLLRVEQPVPAGTAARFEAAGLRVLGFVPPDEYLVRGGDRAALGGRLYHPGHRLDPAIGSAPTRDPEAAGGLRLPLRALLFADASKAAVAERLAAFGATVDEAATWDPRDAPGRVYFRGSPLVLLEAARWPEVRLLQELTLAGRTFAVETKPGIQSGAVLDGTPYHDAGILGAGQIAGIADSGLDVDTILLADTETDAGTVGPMHRKVLSYQAIGNGDTLTCSGMTGYSHGTNVAHDALGNQRDFGLDGNLDGVAPGARMVFFDMQTAASLICQFGGLNPPASLTGSYEDTHAAGGRVYNGSFGLGNGYNNHSLDADQFLWDNRDSMWFFAAGNGGPIGSPATAKNVVAVGGYYQDPFFDFFGSAGPGPDGRMAPTVMAPACDNPGGNPAPFDYQTATSISDDDEDFTGPPSSTLIQGSCGTSFASPFAMGAGMLVRDYFAQGFHPSGAASGADALEPSGALVKAVLMNSGEFLDCGGCGGVRMSNNQGMGRLNLSLSLHLEGDARTVAATRIVDRGMSDGLQTGGSHVETVTITDPSVPLRATVVWVDAPQSALVNDLDLTVVGPGGTPAESYLGNNFTGAWSSSEGAGGLRRDTTNPHESVIIDPAELAAGEWTVTVSGSSVPMGDPAFGDTQPFALVISGGFGEVVPVESDCCNGLDDDGDGLTDLDDPDCASAPPCSETDCGDGLDEDGDGDTDCEDADCRVDADGDGVLGLPCGSDCNDADAGAFAEPGLVTGLLWSAPDTLSWDDQAGATGDGVTYRLVRGLVADLPASGAPSETCLDAALAAPTFSDAATPAPDTAWYYLAAAANTCLPASAGYGPDTLGTPRTPTCP